MRPLCAASSDPEQPNSLPTMMSPRFHLRGADLHNSPPAPDGPCFFRVYRDTTLHFFGKTNINSTVCPGAMLADSQK